MSYDKQGKRSCYKMFYPGDYIVLH